jgi:hypothetical protein
MGGRAEEEMEMGKLGVLRVIRDEIARGHSDMNVCSMWW